MPRRVKGQSRNKKIGSSLVNRFSRSSMYHRSGKWNYKKKTGKPFGVNVAKPTPKVEPKVKPFGKKGETRKVVARTSRHYPTDITSRPLPLNRNVTRPTRLRSSLTPGTVVILLAGRFRGKRVVFLKQLKSGLLLVTGPYKINGVPLRRVNQAYVIATSTKLNVSGVKLDDKFNDAYFRRPKQPKKKKTEKEFFATETKETKKKRNC